MKKALRIIVALSLMSLAAVSCGKTDNVDDKVTLSASPTENSVAAEGGDFIVTITSNSYWDITVTDANGLAATWLTPSVSSGQGDANLTIVAAANSETTERTAFVNVTTASQEITVALAFTQAGSVKPVPTGYSFPICEMFQIDENHNLSNAVISGNTCTFTDGLTISRSGDDSGMAFLCPAHTSPKENAWFQRAISTKNWAAGDYWLITIPVKADLSGDLRFYFGSRKDGITSAGAWKFEWSNDGKTWTAFTGDIDAAGSDAMWKSIDFSIPQSSKVPSGGNLYIKFTAVTAPSSMPYFSHGICITKSSAEKSSLETMNATDVVYSNGFDDVLSANATYIELPIGFMRSWTTGYSTSGYSIPEAYAKYETVANCFGRPGYLQVGYADESLFSRDKSGSFTVLVGERLKEMGYTKADLTLTFKGASITDAYGNKSHANLSIAADGTSGATVADGEIGDKLEACIFKTFTVSIKNATQATTLTFGTPEIATLEAYQKDYRFFLDDILIKVSGNAEKNGNEGNGGVGDYGQGNDWK